MADALLLLPMLAAAQKLTVEKMEVAPMDLSASTQPRNDLVGNPCGLVKVQLATPGASFEGNVIGDAEFKKGEYWVYMTEGSYMLNVKHASFLPLFVNFRDYDIKKVVGKTTYILTLVMPQGNAPVQTQKLTINYSPASAIVMIDSKAYQGNGRVEVELPVGSHDYQVIAVGYETAEGSIKLTASSPRTVTEHLVATSQVAQQQQTPAVVQQPVSEFDGLTASQIADIAEDYCNGRNGKTKDYSLAVKWARKAAELGNSRGQFRLGYCYYSGEGVTQDYAEATKWFRKAADQGYVYAQYNLGLCYYYSRGVTQDYAEATKWWRKAADQGHSIAQYNLGYCYKYGQGVTQDYAEAVKWIRKAADQGVASAQTNLGLCYENGEGVTQDYAEAVKWFRKAADQGEAMGQNNLADCYYNGWGVTQDKNKAKELWRKAAAQGNQNAKDNLKKYFGE